jgi:hypothetical protein
MDRESYSFNLPNGSARYSRNELNRMSESRLRGLRQYNPDSKAQKLLAPYEHQAFARFETRKNPVAGLFVAGPMNAGYELLKAAPKGVQDFAAEVSPLLDVRKSRSGASMENFMGGLRGFAQGVGLAAGPTQAQEDAEDAAFYKSLRSPPRKRTP